jgi:hypothetical protein
MSQDCGCTDPIPVSSDCSECSVECPSTHNSSCIVYNGDFLDNLDITPGQGINDVFTAINTALEAEIFEDVITVTSAQIKLLFSTPKTLIVAPGSGKYISLLSYEIKLDSSTTPYTTGSSNLRIKSLNAANPLAVVSDSVLTTTNTNIVSVPIRSTTGYDTIRVNDPIVLDHQTANPTLGDGILKIYLSYIIKTV